MKQGANQRGRSRGRNNNNNGKRNNNGINNKYNYNYNSNTNFDSNGPGGRIRGTAYQIFEKYLTMARDAAGQNDRILAENFYQHAEHYHRVINSFAERFRRYENQNVQAETTGETATENTNEEIKIAALPEADCTFESSAEDNSDGSIVFDATVETNIPEKTNTENKKESEILVETAVEETKTKPRRFTRKRKPKTEAESETAELAFVAKNPENVISQAVE